MCLGKATGESSDPYYDLFDDFDLIQSSMLEQYGIRLSRDLPGMKWSEFRSLLVGLSPETPLGRIVAIRAENDKEMLKRFSKEQHRIRNEWRERQAAGRSEKETADYLESLKNMFIGMAR